ncbi:MAG TPA: hypothetical protein VHM30_07845 [Gemmatimonadaceae bacterium]|nr:hypothetical protein [Gemmatimonadaceae bacterium]
MRPSLSRLLALLVSAAALEARTATAQTTPPWQKELMPWQTHAGQPRPWRTDGRLAGRSEPGYPDDFPVAFASTDSAKGGLLEVMWVRVTAYDPASDLFLGILLNQPALVKSLAVGENVVFRAVPALNAPATAVGGPSYAEAGWPSSSAPQWFVQLREGIRAYRNGRNGHVMPEIEKCMRLLAPVTAAIPASARPDERLVAHYVLGRCRAEAYQTRGAIEQFRAAIAVDSADLDSHMALLAELSVMTHLPTDSLPAAESARWEREFVDELAIVRARFASDPGVTQILALIFDPSKARSVDPTRQRDTAKLQRLGYGIFRWKQR